MAKLSKLTFDERQVMFFEDVLGSYEKASIVDLVAVCVSLKELTWMEIQVLKLYYENGMSHAEIGVKLLRNRLRIRQIYLRSLKKLRYLHSKSCGLVLEWGIRHTLLKLSEEVYG